MKTAERKQSNHAVSVSRVYTFNSSSYWMMIDMDSIVICQVKDGEKEIEQFSVSDVLQFRRTVC